MPQARKKTLKSFPGKDPVLRKMDLPLRKILGMTDTRIISELDKIKRAASLGGFSRPGAGGGRKRRGGVAPSARDDAARRMPPRHLAPVSLDRRRIIRIRAIVRFNGSRRDLESLGIQVRSQAQDIFTVSATKAQLRTLASQAACRHLRTPRLLYPAVEQASAQGEVADVHNARPLNPVGYNGAGILVGIIDSPLDVTHHGFRNPGGTHDSRVLYYWVQETDTASPPGVTPDQFTAAAPAARPNFTGLTYGRLYTRADINTALNQAAPYGSGNNQIDREPALQEHGTHCAGIAVGGGNVNNWNTAAVHVGAAPQADLVYVCRPSLPGDPTRDDFSEDNLMDALNFCLEAARFHGMPVAISVSQANSLGPHNGADDFDLARDNLLNSFDDRAIVFAAGNDNSWQGYRRGTVAAGNATDTFTLSYVHPQARPVYLDIWYTGPELDFRITRGTNSSGWTTAGQDFQGTWNGWDVEGERDPEPIPGLRGIRMYVESMSAGHTYTIDLRNPHAADTASYSAWTGSQGWWCNISGATQDEMTLADTACARSMLTVGACRKVVAPNPATGETITSYSGAGPTLDGRIKPEIVAVGGEDTTGGFQPQMDILSTNSDQNSGYVNMSGTSMAAPLVAGAVALLFEEYTAQGIHLNMDTVKGLLIGHANQTGLHLDPLQAGYVAEERNRYGNGRLRLIGPIDEIQPPVEVDVWVRTADDDYGQEPYPGGCFCHSPDTRVFPAGSAAESTEINWGSTYTVRVTVRNMGDTPAVGTTVRLKYALPHTAPDAWFEAEDASDHKLVQTVTVPAMGQLDVDFQWRPEQSELGAPSTEHHFCLLAEVSHPADPLVYAAPTTSGGSAWTANIKGTNNIALRNLHVQ